MANIDPPISTIILNVNGLDKLETRVFQIGLKKKSITTKIKLDAIFR
jgi:hypothetical protein